VAAAEAQARSARTDAAREQARLVELEIRLLELEQRLARQPRACDMASDPGAVDLPSSRDQPKTQPLRSEGDFLAEAHSVAPASGPPGAKAAGGTSPRAATAASERQRVAQLLEDLQKYGFDSRSGLSPERREALRVLLRQERQLDLMNPWDGR
jgi:hypothetical protein